MITTQCLLCGTKGIISSKKLADFLARSKHKSNGYWLVDCDWLNNVLKMILLYLRKPRCLLASPYLFSISWGSKASDIKATTKLKMAGCMDLELHCFQLIQLQANTYSMQAYPMPTARNRLLILLWACKYLWGAKLHVNPYTCTPHCFISKSFPVYYSGNSSS